MLGQPMIAAGSSKIPPATVTQAAIPMLGLPPRRCLASRPPIAYPSPASSTARPPSSSSPEPPRSTPSSTATPTTPIMMPHRRVPLSRSSWSTRIASRAVKIGAEQTRMPASDEEISVSPAESSRKGPVIWESPISATLPATPEKPASAPRGQANATRTAAPSATRPNATIPGERSRTPILISM